MPLEGSYAIWNNRGGTGKTTLTYHLANKYAFKHPDKTILIIDMCPQADISHALLGDDTQGLDYVSQIGTLKKDFTIIDDKKYPKTVSGYLDVGTSIGLPQNIDPRTFLINVSKYNSQLPRNLYLLCGDASIELIGRSLELKRNSNSLSLFNGLNPWKAITLCIKNFIRRIAERKGIRLITFIDCNSAFSIATEIALCAADRLLIPISDDHLHRNDFEYMFALLYGYSQPSNVYYYYRHLSLYYRANDNDVQLPKIHLILNTNSKTNDKCEQENLTRLWQFVYETFKKHPEVFNSLKNFNNLNEFLNEFVFNLNLDEKETTNEIKQAVKIHSPLLTVRNSFNNYSLMSSPSSPPNSTPTHTPTTPTKLKHKLSLRLSRSNNTTNGNNNINTASLSNNDYDCCLSATSTSSSNTLLFDKKLNDIVEKL